MNSDLSRRKVSFRTALPPTCQVKVALFGLLLLLTWAGLISRPQEMLAQEEPPTFVDPGFGIVEAFWSPEQAAELGAGWERILFYWSEIQPTGPEDWNTLHVREEWLRDAGAHGRQVVGLLKHTPEWATSGPIYGGVPDGLYLPVDDPANLWAGFVRRIAEYYGPLGVHHWIIWNEPDIDPGTYGNEFAGSVEEYYQMVKVASLVMKEVDPAARIHLAGLTFWHDQVAGRPQYLERFLQVAVADPQAAEHDYFFDYVSLHIYFRVETVPWIVARMNEIQRSFGIDKPIWINETNAAPTLDPQWPVDRPEFTVDLEQQAWYLVQAYALGFAAGAESIGVYKFSDVLVPPGEESFGLLRADFSERPAFAAYQTIIRYLSNFTAVRQQEDPAYWSIGFSRPDGDVRVLWARQPEAITLVVPAAAEQATLVDAFGETTPIRTEAGAYRITLPGARCYDECIIGGPPVLIVEEHEPPESNDTTIAAEFPTAIIVARETATPAPTPVATVATPDAPGSRFPAQLGSWFLAALLIGLLGLAVVWLALRSRK